jgi:hypothetical protein
MASDRQPRTTSVEPPRPVQTSTTNVPMNDEERAHFYKQRRSRSIALALALAAAVVLFYVISLIQGPGMFQRPI